MAWADSRDTQRTTIHLLASETVRGRHLHSLLLNISADGAYVEYPIGIERPRHHDSILEITLPGVSSIIWARCKIVREESKGFFKGLALKFIEISALDRALIRHYIHRCFGNS